MKDRGKETDEAGPGFRPGLRLRLDRDPITRKRTSCLIASIVRVDGDEWKEEDRGGKKFGILLILVISAGL
jgi:hypothetical protein